MTPEEKAKQLYWKHVDVLQNNKTIKLGADMSKPAKESAILCVKEILDYLYTAVTIIYEDGGERLDPTLYWRQVKKELECYPAT